jgi:Uma2 family endonuclease
MVLAPSTDTASPPEQELAVLRLPLDLRLTPQQFERVCQANRDAVLELAADGQIIVMTPTGGETSSRNSRLLIQLGIALHQGDPNLRIFDSSGGFLLPDGSVLSPDAALVWEARWQALTPDQRRGFPPLCPDLVIELASASDAGPRGLKALRQKMAQYQANGAQLGWLLLPELRAVEIWRGSQEGSERLENPSRLEAGEAFSGLALELASIWQS